MKWILLIMEAAITIAVVMLFRWRLKEKNVVMGFITVIFLCIFMGVFSAAAVSIAPQLKDKIQLTQL